jgi:hypothetical protein
MGRTLRLAAIAAVVCGSVAAAQSAAADDPYTTARRAAAHHVQMRIKDVQDLPWYLDKGPCNVQGEVVRVFRGDYERGDDLTIAIDCAKPRARVKQSPQGPLWTSWRAIKDAGYVEAYLDEEGEVARWQTVLLSEASDEPACPVDAAGTC